MAITLTSIMRPLSAAILAGAMTITAQAQNASPAADPLPRAAPEEAGMSSARLAGIARTLNADIARGQMPGAVLAVARHGKLVYFEAFGWRDKAANAPMTTDAIFNIASMASASTFSVSWSSSRANRTSAPTCRSTCGGRSA